MDKDTRSGAILKLPSDWNQDEAPFMPVAQGDYTVVVLHALQDDPDRVTVDFQIRGQSDCVGRHLFASYVLTTPVGKRLFKELLNAVSIEPRQDSVGLAELVGCTLRVTVRHNTRDEKVYANVVQHRSSN